MLQNLLFVIIGAVLVIVGADKLTDGAVGVARRFQIPEMVIGLTIVGFGTSLPEFMVSLLSGVQGASGMSIGNIVGSNLFNALVIIGVSAALYPIAVTHTAATRDIPLTLVSSVVLTALSLDILLSGGSSDVLSRGDGIVLLCFFAIFMAYTYSMAKSGTLEETVGGAPMSGLRMTLYIILGLVALVGGGELFVEGSCGIARSLGVSEAVIGLTLAAGGTSLPELAASVVAARKGRSAMAIGNIVGSILFNTFWVLGVCALIRPLPASGVLWTDYAMLVFGSFLFMIFARSRHRLGRWEGVVMVLSYVAYLAWLILF
ncbi:MAG: calcium/sodium antiporter [Bacteroidaceae bacterium]|nr:calcium/sodium antiporter [Bacteroidaceae bacterium]